MSRTDQKSSTGSKKESESFDFYKKKCEILENDLFKSQTQIKKLEELLKKMQDLNTIYAQNMNNTSISFFLPSEFKSTWENFLKDQLIDGFENIFHDFYWLSHLVQDTMKLIYEETNSLIKEKVLKTLEFFNIKDQNTDKFLIRFKNFFQEFFFNIFVCSDEFNQKIIENLLKISKNYKDFPYEEELNEDINGKSFKNLILIAFKLMMYMHLHDPILTLNIESYENREIEYSYFDKNEYILIDGQFSKGKISCITILPPPQLRNKYNFQSIKPGVCIITNVTEEIKTKCDNKVSQYSKTCGNENRSEEKTLSIKILETKENVTPEKELENNNSNENFQYNTCPNNPELQFKEKLNSGESQTNEIPILSNEKLNTEMIIEDQLQIEKIKSSNEKPSKYLTENIIPQDIRKENKSALIKKENHIEDTVEEFRKCFDHPLSMEKKFEKDSISILQNLKSSLKTMRSGNQGEKYNTKSKSRDHMNTENINNNLSHLDNSFNNQKKQTFNKSNVKVCDANTINYPLKVNENVTKDGKKLIDNEIKKYFTEKNNTSLQSNNYFSSNENFNKKIYINYGSSSAMNNSNLTQLKPENKNYQNDINSSNLKKNMKDAFEYVNSNNNINPLKFGYSSSSKKTVNNDMKFNAPKKDNVLKYDKEKTESNFKIKIERMYSQMTPDTSKNINFNSSKNDFSSSANEKKKSIFKRHLTDFNN